MNGNSNKILLGVAALLTVVLVVLFISSGTSGGGGGGGSAPAPQQTQDQTAQTQQGDQTTQTDQTQQPGDATQQAPEQTTEPSSTGTQDYDPSAEKQMTLEELEQELDNYQAPVGDNPRDAANSQAVPTVAQTHQTASDRGFGSLDIMVDFALDGTYTTTGRATSSVTSPSAR